MFASVQIAVVAPMPIDSVSTATAVNPRLLASDRRAYTVSRRTLVQPGRVNLMV